MHPLTKFHNKDQCLDLSECGCRRQILPLPAERLGSTCKVRSSCTVGPFWVGQWGRLDCGILIFGKKVWFVSTFHTKKYFSRQKRINPNTIGYRKFKYTAVEPPHPLEAFPLATRATKETQTVLVAVEAEMISISCHIVRHVGWHEISTKVIEFSLNSYRMKHWTSTLLWSHMRRISTRCAFNRFMSFPPTEI